MQPTKTLRVLLALSSLVAVAIGASLLFTPVQFQAGNGIELASDPNLLSEVRAPGGALLALGLLMGVGVFLRSFARTSATIATAVYLAYGGARLVGFALDGMPESGLVVATVAELVIGTLCALALLRSAGQRHAGRTA